MDEQLPVSEHSAVDGFEAETLIRTGTLLLASGSRRTAVTACPAKHLRGLAALSPCPSQADVGLIADPDVDGAKAGLCFATCAESRPVPNP
jgi:hypothetical protein